MSQAVSSRSPLLRRGALDLAVVAAALLTALVVAVILVAGPDAGQPSSAGLVAGSPHASSNPLSTPGPSSLRSGAIGGVPVLVGAGDIGNCKRFEDDLTADVVEATTGIVFTLGDNAYPNGSVADFENCYGPSWGRPSIRDRTRPAAGQTDYYTPGASGYFGYFGAAAGDADRGYYTYDAGTWRVYVLNSNCRNIGLCGVGSPQDRWLRADLAANPHECVLAMWHDPFFSSGRSAGSTSMREFWRVLQDAGAEVVLSGHDHVYERFAPQTAVGDADPVGIVQFVVGTGGGDTDELLYEAPNSLVRASGVAGVLRLELAPGSYAFEFLGVAGPEFEDSGVADCH